MMYMERIRENRKRPHKRPIRSRKDRLTRDAVIESSWALESLP